MPPPRPCRNQECDNTVSSQMQSGFCFNCTARLLKERDELFADLDKVTRLAAEFDAYCKERGLPDPHDKD